MVLLPALKPAFIPLLKLLFMEKRAPGAREQEDYVFLCETMMDVLPETFEKQVSLDKLLEYGISLEGLRKFRQRGDFLYWISCGFQSAPDNDRRASGRPDRCGYDAKPRTAYAGKSSTRERLQPLETGEFIRFSDNGKHQYKTNRRTRRSGKFGQYCTAAD